MKGWVWDDGGRADAGYLGHTGDCVVRAFSILWRYSNPHQSPATCYNRALAACLLVDEQMYQVSNIQRDECESIHQRLAGFLPSGVRGTPIIADALGYVPYTPRRVISWADLMNLTKPTAVVVGLPQHLTTIVRGTLRDTGDVRDDSFNRDSPMAMYFPRNRYTDDVIGALRTHTK